MRTMETCIYPVLRKRGHALVLLRRARAGQNEGKWVPIGKLISENEAARDSASAQCAELGLEDQVLDFCGIVSETSTEGWAVLLLLFRLNMMFEVTPSADGEAAEYRWFRLGDLPNLPKPQSDSLFDYEMMLVRGGFYEARMRFGKGGRLESSLVP